MGRHRSRRRPPRPTRHLNPYCLAAERSLAPPTSGHFFHIPLQQGLYPQRAPFTVCPPASSGRPTPVRQCDSMAKKLLLQRRVLLPTRCILALMEFQWGRDHVLAGEPPVQIQLLTALRAKWKSGKLEPGSTFSTLRASEQSSRVNRQRGGHIGIIAPPSTTPTADGDRRSCSTRTPLCLGCLCGEW